VNAPESLPSAVHTTSVRASSWGSLFDCGHKWEGEHLLGMRKPSGLRAQLGTAIHASTAKFDNGRLPGGDKISVNDAAGAFVDTLYKPEREVDYSQDDLTLKEAESIGLSLHRDYCFDISPRFEFISVEQKLKPLDIDCGGGHVVRLTGSMDRARVARAEGGVVIPDIKSGGRVIAKDKKTGRDAVVLKGRKPQIGTYQLLYEHTEGVQTVGGQILALHTSGKPKAMASPIFDAKAVMLGTETSRGLIEFAADMFRTGLFPPNPQSMLCAERYCARWATCNFHE
jgi:hypothetical protein